VGGFGNGGWGMERCTWLVIHTYRVRRRLGLPSGRENWAGTTHKTTKKKKKRRLRKRMSDDRGMKEKEALDGGRRKSLVCWNA